MKDKFEEIVRHYTKEAHINVGKGCNHTTYIICSDFEKLAKECNTLHQQALKEKVKEILDRLCYNPKEIPTILKEIAKENNIKL